MLFCNAYPSWTGVAIVLLYPLSSTRAVDRPQANEVRTESLQIKIAGNWNFSKRNFVSLSRFSLLWIEFSVRIRGVSLGWSERFFIRDFSKSSSNTSKLTKTIKSLGKLTCALLLEKRLDSHMITFEAQVVVPTNKSDFLAVIHFYILFMIKGAFDNACTWWNNTPWLVFSTVAY